MRVRGVTTLVAIAGVAAIAVSGCSESATPTSLNESTQGQQKQDEQKSDSDSASAAEQEAPELPQAATSHLNEGAGAFVEHVVELYNYGIDSEDHAPIAEVSDDACEECKTLYPPSPQRLEGAHWVPDGPLSYGVDKDPYTATVFLPMKTEAGKLYDGTESKAQTLAAYSWTLEATLTWEGDSWRIRALETDS